MSKIPRGKEMVRKLLRLGFVVARQRGSHQILKHASGKIIIIPVHAGRELKVGLFKDILSQLKLSEKDFWKL